jgi:septal ring factor EnvC (AmiA/AmiB activator)
MPFQLRRKPVGSAAVHDLCATCGSVVDPTWAFCGVCGAANEPGPQDTASVPDEATVTERPYRDTHWLTWRRLAVGAAVIIIGVLVLNDIGTHERLFDTRTALAVARDDLRDTRGRLTTTQRELAGTQGRLASTESELSARTKERDDLRAQVDTKNSELVGVRGSLTAAEGRVNLQASHIETLKSCLNGVSEALVHAARGDYSAALAALRSVEVSCDRAYELF